MSGCRLVDCGSSQAGALRSVLEQAFGHAPPEPELAWWLHGGPSGPAAASLMLDGDGSPVGSGTMALRRISLDGEERLAGLAAHMATDPAARRRGVFSALELRNEALAAARGGAVALVFPSPAAAPIYRRRLGWRDLPGVSVRVRPLSTGAPAVAGALEELGADVDELCTAARPSARAYLVRDAAYLRWRYLESPREYAILAQRRRDRLAALAVLGRAKRRGLRIAVLAELIALPDAGGDEIRTLLGRCAAAARGAHVLAAAASPLLRGQGFLPTPYRIRAMGKELAEGVALPAERSAWHLTLGDVDFL